MQKKNKPAEVLEIVTFLLLYLMTQQPISRLKPGDINVAPTPLVRQSKLSAPQSHRRSVVTEASRLRRVALLDL